VIGGGMSEDNFLDFNLQELHENLPASTNQTLDGPLRDFDTPKEEKSVNNLFFFN